MELSGARVLVVGGTGVLGAMMATALVDRGARVVVTGRDEGRLATIAAAVGTEPIRLDVVDDQACAAAVASAVDQLGGLDGLVVATGVPAFGPAVETDPAVAEELFAVNTLGPMSLVRAAAPHLAERDDHDGFVAVLSAILADLPTNQMAEYSASKSALSAWLDVLRRENRRQFAVLDVRPPHLDTGLSDHPLAGTAPKLPDPLAGQVVVDTMVRAIEQGAHEITWDPKAKELTIS
ncbi:SDR family NAD(P)-dependent oxidoreductase [Aeromicrobium sp. CF3.5]|uniref:SDR family NAD(P)-dependent oxidoreductase n=1 Tax=Aeromicrobium sp. CF3.5 TaxID=3373078 RepID=UPI003EE4D210